MGAHCLFPGLTVDWTGNSSVFSFRVSKGWLIVCCPVSPLRWFDWNTSGVKVDPNESLPMWPHLPSPHKQPSLSSLTFPAVHGSWSSRWDQSDWNKNDFSTCCRWSSLHSPQLLNLYFGCKTSAGTPGKDNRPLTGGDVSTFSPYGALNSTKLLPNLHNMLGIWSPCFSVENSCPLPAWPLFWRAVWKCHL